MQDWLNKKVEVATIDRTTTIKGTITNIMKRCIEVKSGNKTYRIYHKYILYVINRDDGE